MEPLKKIFRAYICDRIIFKNKKMRTEQERKKLYKISDFADKSLLIVDDDNPLRDRLARAMEKKRIPGDSGGKCG